MHSKLFQSLFFVAEINVAKFHLNFRIGCVAPGSGGVGRVPAEVLVTRDWAAESTGEGCRDHVGSLTVPSLTSSPGLCFRHTSDILSSLLCVETIVL